MYNNNTLKLKGYINERLTLSHKVLGENFYKTTIQVARMSRYLDEIRVIISERLITKKLLPGDYIEINGQLRTHNTEDGRLDIFAFVKEIENVSCGPNINNIELEGTICRKPIYRKTIFGREISDLMVAVNRQYNKSDYIPVIMWGRNAKYISNFEVGTPLALEGRVQSRAYKKLLEEGNIIDKIAYEVSASNIQII